MNHSFDYTVFRPFGWIAFSVWVLGILGPELFGFSDAIGNGLFIAGFLVFLIGGYRGLRSEKK